ncbi:MAG: hypothetical protein OIN85_01150 [Candidatus Methanoperedens sp.]|nr:hypothetical protein [Candidatus Methanoperedens sp.]
MGVCGENVHQHADGKWFFWDEVQCDEYGPYDTKEECQDKLQLYCDTYLKPGPVS